MARKGTVKSLRLTRPPSAGDIKFDRRAFATALDRVIVDDEFRQELNEQPVRTLGKLGIKLSAADARRFRGKTLQEAMPVVPGGDVMTVAVSVAPYVWVVVAITVGNEFKQAEDDVIQPARKRRLITKVSQTIDAQQKAWRAAQGAPTR